MPIVSHQSTVQDRRPEAPRLHHLQLALLRPWNPVTSKFSSSNTITPKTSPLLTPADYGRPESGSVWTPEDLNYDPWKGPTTIPSHVHWADVPQEEWDGTSLRTTLDVAWLHVRVETSVTRERVVGLKEVKRREACSPIAVMDWEAAEENVRKETLNDYRKERLMSTAAHDPHLHKHDHLKQNESPSGAKPLSGLIDDLTAEVQNWENLSETESEASSDSYDYVSDGYDSWEECRYPCDEWGVLY